MKLKVTLEQTKNKHVRAITTIQGQVMSVQSDSIAGALHNLAFVAGQYKQLSSDQMVTWEKESLEQTTSEAKSSS